MDANAERSTTGEVSDALISDLNKYLVGCPDPAKVPAVKKASRLLWRCRAALEAAALPSGVAEDVARVIDEGDGMWTPCSGCYESREGYDNTDFPYSDTFRCRLGGGCHECGGLGATWLQMSEEADDALPVAAYARVAEAAKRLRFDVYALTTSELRAAFDGRESIEVLQRETAEELKQAIVALAALPVDEQAALKPLENSCFTANTAHQQAAPVAAPMGGDAVREALRDMLELRDASQAGRLTAKHELDIVRDARAALTATPAPSSGEADRLRAVVRELLDLREATQAGRLTDKHELEIVRDARAALAARIDTPAEVD